MTLQSTHGSLSDPDRMRASYLSNQSSGLRTFLQWHFKGGGGERTQQLVFSDSETLTFPNLFTLSHLLRDPYGSKTDRIELKDKVSITENLPCEPGSTLDGRPGGSERFPMLTLVPRDVSLHRRESAPEGAPSPGHLLAPSTEPASDTHTHTPTHTESSAPLDQPSSKTEVRELLPTRAQNAPCSRGQSLREDPCLHGKIKKRALGRFPTESLRTPNLRVRLRHQNHLDFAALKHKLKACFQGHGLSWHKNIWERCGWQAKPISQASLEKFFATLRLLA